LRHTKLLHSDEFNMLHEICAHFISHTLNTLGTSFDST